VTVGLWADCRGDIQTTAGSKTVRSFLQEKERAGLKNMVENA
jgi:hypothetical protein